MANLTLWDDIKAVPPEAQKPIKGGRLSGMTDISPMWRYHELTKHFGPCGIGWKYTIDRLWLEPGANDTVCAFAQISLFIKQNCGLDIPPGSIVQLKPGESFVHNQDYGEWAAAIPGIGGSMLVAKEKEGLHTSDECYKMAVTDALSVACKMLGMGADIYWMAGSKYRTDEQAQTNAPYNPPKPHTKAPTTEVKAPASPELKDALWAKCLDAAAGDSKLAEEVLKICSVFTDKTGNEQFLTLEKLNVASEKYVSSALRNFASKSKEISDYCVGSLPY